MEKIYQNLLNEAKKASENAYAKYSDFQVGACVLYESGKHYLGCNVENASYGLSLCAERNAMAQAVLNNEKTKLKAIAIYAKKQKRCVPCGACRQWISEFGDDNTKVILEDDNDELLILSMKDIFPFSFKFD